MKGRYLISKKQIDQIKKFALNTEAVKLLRVLREVEHMQYIGDSILTVKEDLKKMRMVI